MSNYLNSSKSVNIYNHSRIILTCNCKIIKVFTENCQKLIKTDLKVKDIIPELNSRANSIYFLSQSNILRTPSNAQNTITIGFLEI